MATTYTPDPTTVHGDITIPSDGDLEVAESVNSPLRDLADNVSEARSHVDGDAVDTTIGASSVDVLVVHATSQFVGPVSCSQPVTLNNTFTANAPSTFNAPVTCASGTLTAAAGFSCTGTTTFHSAVTFSSTIACTGAAGFNGGVAINADSTLSGVLFASKEIVFSGAGRVTERYRVMPDANVSDFGPATKSAMFNGTGVLSASRKIIIDDTDARDGDWFEVTNEDDTWAISVRYPDDSNTIGTALIKSGTGSAPFHAKYRRMGGVWYQVSVCRWAP
jgi:hypothetical protein